MKSEKAQAVNIAALKARLSHYLKLVRGGRAVTVMDRSTPVAKIVPYADVGPELRVRKATLKPSDVRLASRPAARATDSLAVLLADRNSSR